MRRHRTSQVGSRGRRGWTLLEMVTVLAVNGIILTVSVSLLFLLIDARAAAKRSREGDLQWSRLAERFETDAEAASQLVEETTENGATAEDAAIVFRLTRSDGAEAVYTFDPRCSAMTRALHTDDGISEQDVYTFAAGTTVRVAREEDADQVISLARRAPDGLPIGHRTATAVLGWTGRYIVPLEHE